MKRAVSISLGSSKRNKVVELELLGERVRLERIGVDGDMRRAAQLFRELDGQADALGVGGADLGLRVAGRWYPLHSVQPLVRGVTRTPVTDGAGLKNTLERRVAPFIDARCGPITPRRVFFTDGADRWGMTLSFHEAGYEHVFGDLMFALGLPLPIHSLQTAQTVAALVLPIIGRLPFHWVYPTGERQEQWTPKFERWYRWATVIAGDCHYIKRHLPARLDGQIICTNTITPDDVARFRAAGVRWLVTTTPVIEGRSFGANLLEAALIAISGRHRLLSDAELEALIDMLQLQPTVQDLTMATDGNGE
ncbi:MAG: hypothetical protein RMK99_15520 [Anaerolineales bacterium]|nr:hypothetical protein [Anaerolineales bacterium]